MSLTESDMHDAALVLNTHWASGTKLDVLPEACRPQSRHEGYRIASALAELRRERTVGWKIAATSKAGQAHINVDGPLAGRLYESRIVTPGSRVSLGGNAMKVTEVEFAFRFGNDLPRNSREYSLSEVMSSVASLHLSVEIPDSRYANFTKVGAPSLIADTACADWLVLGPAIQQEWRNLDLAAFTVKGIKNGENVAIGTGRAALGDPRVALTWLVNELCHYADGIKLGTVVTTGTCVVPVAITAGDHFLADYGELGQISVDLIA
jgi:2-keto-4-pentenoate hydratase